MARTWKQGDEYATRQDYDGVLPLLPEGLNWGKGYVNAVNGLQVWVVIKRGNAQPRDDKATFAKWEPEPAPKVQHPLMGVDMPAPVLTTDKHARKLTPIFSGFLRYFPRATAAVAALSQIGNEQHNPGTPLHWDRSKGGDEHDALVRHLLEAGTYDTDGVRHSTKVAWRAMAALEKELEDGDRDTSDAEDLGPGC